MCERNVRLFLSLILQVKTHAMFQDPQESTSLAIVSKDSNSDLCNTMNF